MDGSTLPILIGGISFGTFVICFIYWADQIEPIKNRAERHRLTAILYLVWFLANWLFLISGLLSDPYPLNVLVGRLPVDIGLSIFFFVFVKLNDRQKFSRGAEEF